MKGPKLGTTVETKNSKKGITKLGTAVETSNINETPKLISDSTKSNENI
jgi:hypothetical protein